MLYERLRRIYQRTKEWPIVGPLVQALRYRQWPRWRGIHQRLAEQEAQMELVMHALAGLRTGHQNLLERIANLETQWPEALHQTNLATDAKLARLAERLEFIRQEWLYELRYRNPAQPPTPAAEPTPPSTLINAAKLEAMRRSGAIRLNLGCGHKPDPDRLNVDRRELPGVDLVAEVTALPFAPGEVAEIYAAHLLEHFPHEQLQRQILPYWVKLLAPGGQLRLIVPDAQAMIAHYTAGETDWETLRRVLYGDQEYEGDFHHTMFSPQSLIAMLEAQGLTRAEVVAANRPNGLCWECEIVAYKP